MRSTFVSVVAWVFIVLGGFSTLIAVLQNIMIAVVFPRAGMRQAMAQADNMQQMPAVFRFLFDNFQLWFAAFLVLSLLTLVSAIGLLRRKNWARLIFIGVMVIGVLWNVGGLVMMFFLAGTFPPMSDQTPQDIREQMELMQKIMLVVSSLIGLAVAGLFAWIIKRLVSEDIRREFVSG